MPIFTLRRSCKDDVTHKGYLVFSTKSHLFIWAIIGVLKDKAVGWVTISTHLMIKVYHICIMMAKNYISLPDT